METFKAIDLFCGAGGLSLGLKNSGFDIILGVDIDESALKTYKNNFNKTQILNEDIRYVTSSTISKLTGIAKGDNFLLAGCPPCQGFSNIGKRDQKDIKNQLVFDYVRLVMELEPSFILMENVPGMSRGVGKEIFKQVVSELNNKYKTEHAILNSADYGVPQIRKRLVLHGIRSDIYYELIKLSTNKDGSSILPKKTHSDPNKNDGSFTDWINLKNAIYDLPPIQAGEEYSGNKKIFNHRARSISDKNLFKLNYIRNNGGSRNCLPDEYVLECHKNSKTSYGDTYGVMDWYKPSPTLTSGCTSISKGRFGHPEQNRAISFREAARIQTFTDDFIFHGNMNSMSLQIGNAVPPLLAQASGMKIIQLMKKINNITNNL